MKQGIKEKDIRDFVKCAKKLDSIMKRIREYMPEASLYANQETLCLLPCASHYDNGKDNSNKIIESVLITGMDSGAW